MNKIPDSTDNARNLRDLRAALLNEFRGAATSLSRITGRSMSVRDLIRQRALYQHIGPLAYVAGEVEAALLRAKHVLKKSSAASSASAPPEETTRTKGELRPYHVERLYGLAQDFSNASGAEELSRWKHYIAKIVATLENDYDSPAEHVEAWRGFGEALEPRAEDLPQWWRTACDDLHAELGSLSGVLSRIWLASPSKLLAAEIDSEQTLFELGCGDADELARIKSSYRSSILSSAIAKFSAPTKPEPPAPEPPTPPKPPRKPVAPPVSQAPSRPHAVPPLPTTVRTGPKPAGKKTHVSSGNASKHWLLFDGGPRWDRIERELRAAFQHVPAHQPVALVTYKEIVAGLRKEKRAMLEKLLDGRQLFLESFKYGKAYDLPTDCTLVTLGDPRPGTKGLTTEGRTKAALQELAMLHCRQIQTSIHVGALDPTEGRGAKVLRKAGRPKGALPSDAGEVVRNYVAMHGGNRAAARVLGTSEGTLRHWLSGHRSPSEKNLAAMRNALRAALPKSA